MNEITTQSPTSLTDKEVLRQRIIKNGAQLLEDYVLWRKNGWSDAEFGELLGISAKTVRNRFLADARKQGLVEGAKQGARKDLERSARNQALPVKSGKNDSLSKLPENPQSSITRAVQIMNDDGIIEPTSTTAEELAEVATGLYGIASGALVLKQMNEAATDDVLKPYGRFSSDGEFIEYEPYEQIIKLLPKLNRDELNNLQNYLFRNIDSIDV